MLVLATLFKKNILEERTRLKTLEKWLCYRYVCRRVLYFVQA